MDYPDDIPCLVKLNSKTNLVKTCKADPFSNQWIHMRQVEGFQKNGGPKRLAVAYAVYLESKYGTDMPCPAAQLVYDTVVRGSMTALWVYPAGKAIGDEGL